MRGEIQNAELITVAFSCNITSDKTLNNSGFFLHSLFLKLLDGVEVKQKAVVWMVIK